MPCFNHALFVGRSIEAVLAQSVGDLELIVIDDCSRDHSRETIAQYVKNDRRVRALYHERNLGASRSRNDGIRVAEGEYLAFCDADDVWMPTKLARQLELMERHPMHDVAYCDAEIINEHGIRTGERFTNEFPVPGNGSGRLFDELCTRNFVNMQTAILRRKSVGAAARFDENIKWVEDWLFWLRIAHDHSFIYTNEVLAEYRVHQKSTGRNQRRGNKINRVKVYRRILREYPEIPSKLKSAIYYHLGAALTELGKRQFARRCYIRSIKARRSNVRAFYRLLVSLLKFGSRQSGIREAGGKQIPQA
jgi:glycosyltransferase involved in cell wall biosynthesis